MKNERGVVSNVDTFAQWTQTDFNINIVLPESQEPIKITANPSSIGQGEACDVFLTYGLGDNTINVTGNLKQVVHTGNAMSEVVLTPNNYKKCFPIDWVKNETRPSGIKMLGDSINGASLGFSGTPTSDDTINIPQLINKFVVSLPTNLSTKHYNWDSSVQEADKYFLNSMRVIITADEGYKFATNMEYSDVTITPTTMTQYLTMTRLSDNKLEFSLKDKSELDLTKLSDVQIDIPACDRSTYRVEIAIGPHMTTSGGELIQNVVIGQPITQINLAVTDGMTFMPNIHNYSKDGITINVDTSTGAPYTKAWVSGTPLRDTQITVRDVVKGVKLNVVLPSDGSVLVKSGEESRVDQFIESGRTMGVVTLVPATNYHMDQEWKKQIQVTPVNDHIVITTSEHETQISGTIVDDTVVTIPSGLRNHTQFVKVNLGANLSLVEGGVSTSGIPMQLIRNRVKAKDGYYLPNDYSVSMIGDTSTGFSETKYRSASEVIYETQMDKCNITITFPAATTIPRDGLFLTIGESSTRYGWDSQVSPVYGDLRMPMIYSWPAICLWCDKLNNGNYRIEMRASNNPTSSGNRIAVSFLLGSDGAPSTATLFKNFKVENGIGIWWTEEAGDRLGNIYKYLQTRNGKIVEVLLADYEA